MANHLLARSDAYDERNSQRLEELPGGRSPNARTQQSKFSHQTNTFGAPAQTRQNRMEVRRCWTGHGRKRLLTSKCMYHLHNKRQLCTCSAFSNRFRTRLLIPDLNVPVWSGEREEKLIQFYIQVCILKIEFSPVAGWCTLARAVEPVQRFRQNRISADLNQ